MNILEESNEILSKKDKEHQYGNHLETMPRLASTLSALSGKQWTPEDVYLYTVISKLNREVTGHSHDNILDAITYLAMWNEYEEYK